MLRSGRGWSKRSRELKTAVVAMAMVLVVVVLRSWFVDENEPSVVMDKGQDPRREHTRR
jgi:hypothetical protein